VNATPNVEVCANCGAPLEIDKSGACRWCHARIHTEQDPLSIFSFNSLSDFMDQTALVPEDADDCWTSAPFLFLALSTLGPLLSTESVVQQYMKRDPGLFQQIRALTTAVSQAGVRVRDAGLLKDDLDENLAVYTPEEIWTFDLAFDLIAMIGALDGLPGRVKAKAASDLRNLDHTAHQHAFKNAMKKAGEGPVAFHELRARVPYRA
jgi:hypothetical protein